MVSFKLFLRSGSNDGYLGYYYIGIEKIDEVYRGFFIKI